MEKKAESGKSTQDLLEQCGDLRKETERYYWHLMDHFAKNHMVNIRYLVSEKEARLTPKLKMQIYNCYLHGNVRDDYHSQLTHSAEEIDKLTDSEKKTFKGPTFPKGTVGFMDKLSSMFRLGLQQKQDSDQWARRALSYSSSLDAPFYISSGLLMGLLDLLIQETPEGKEKNSYTLLKQKFEITGKLLASLEHLDGSNCAQCLAQYDKTLRQSKDTLTATRSHEWISFYTLVARLLKRMGFEKAAANLNDHTMTGMKTTGRFFVEKAQQVINKNLPTCNDPNVDLAGGPHKGSGGIR